MQLVVPPAHSEDPRENRNDRSDAALLPLRFVELSQNISAGAGGAVFSRALGAGNEGAIVGEVMFVGLLPDGLRDRQGDGALNDGDVGPAESVFVGLRVEPTFANCDGTFCYDAVRHFEGLVTAAQVLGGEGDDRNRMVPGQGKKRDSGGGGGGVLCGLYVPAADVAVVSSDCARRVAKHRLARSTAMALHALGGAESTTVPEEEDVPSVHQLAGAPTAVTSSVGMRGATRQGFAPTAALVQHPSRLDGFGGGGGGGAQTPQPVASSGVGRKPLPWDAVSDPPTPERREKKQKKKTFTSHIGEMQMMIRQRRLGDDAEIARIRAGKS
jgi:hypothetical protein